jgi:hypothetical protein
MPKSQKVKIRIKKHDRWSWQWRDVEVDLGDRIYADSWGDENRSGIIVGFGEKNNSLVIDYRADNGAEYWTYPEQIYRVEFK